MMDFLFFFFILTIGFTVLQSLFYKYAMKSIHKYKKGNLFYTLLEMHVKKGPKLDFSDYSFIFIPH
ncbi:hypothetical protein [Bacillus sp. UNC322MFChir4.1]|uniref:hypothetical protein n=1 Tax=Bacillus sp. UNC322MFChir4.1 TaxID=1449045 RepID=UPI00055285B8|nr:hypothetical protein [Bacillus sp. UNC322MFChir4.1]